MSVHKALSRTWTKNRRLFAFLSSQAATQAIAVVVGLIVVRLLSVEDYAFYALFGALAGAAAVTCDLGTAAALTTLLSRTSDPQERQAIIGQVAWIRIVLTAASVLLFAGIFLAFAPATGKLGLLVLGGLILVIMLQSRATLARAVLASMQRLDVIKRADPYAAVLRLALLGGAFAFLGQTGIILPVGAWVASASILALWLHASSPRVPIRQWHLPDSVIMRIIVPLLPGNIYYIIGGLVPILSLNNLASANEVADFWALGRLGMIYAALLPVINLVAHPYVARGHDQGFAERSRLVIGAVLLIGVVATLSGLALPKMWLLLLGQQYAHVGGFVAVALLLSSLNILASTVYTMIVASGETGRQYLAVGTCIAVQVGAYALNPLEDLASVYVYLLAIELTRLIAHAVLYWRSMRILNNRARK